MQIQVRLKWHFCHLSVSRNLYKSGINASGLEFFVTMGHSTAKQHISQIYFKKEHFSIKFVVNVQLRKGKLKR